MIKIPALLFLFLMQFLLIFLGLAIFLFQKNRKQSAKTILSQGEIRRLEAEIQTKDIEVSELLNLKKTYEELHGNFEQMRTVNAKLKEMVDTLIPEAERSQEMQDLLSQMEQNNKELDTCLGTIQKENVSLNERLKSSERETEKLSTRMKDMVKKEDYQHVMSEKKNLELKLEKLKDDLDKKTKECEKLEKNFIYLEKEYNALYKNIKGEDP